MIKYENVVLCLYTIATIVKFSILGFTLEGVIEDFFLGSTIYFQLLLSRLLYKYHKLYGGFFNED